MPAKEVDAGDPCARAREPDRVPAGTATEVEHRATDHRSEQVVEVALLEGNQRVAIGARAWAPRS
jgi:hypothetical protein